MTGESKPIASWPAQVTKPVQAGQVVIVEVHDNGYTYVRPIEARDLPGHNTTHHNLRSTA